MCSGGGSQAVERDADVLSLGIFNFLYFRSFQSTVGEGPRRSAPRQALGWGHADAWLGIGNRKSDAP